jgi:hypothetical protein
MGGAGRDDPPPLQPENYLIDQVTQGAVTVDQDTWPEGYKPCSLVSCKFVHLNIDANETYKPKSTDGLYYNHKHGEFLCQIIDCQLLGKLTYRRHLYYVDSFCYSGIFYTHKPNVTVRWHTQLCILGFAACCLGMTTGSPE